MTTEIHLSFLYIRGPTPGIYGEEHRVMRKEKSLFQRHITKWTAQGPATWQITASLQVSWLSCKAEELMAGCSWIIYFH